MKVKILTLLRERKDFVSGQELCESFGVSRTAVWKAITKLKSEGYNIEAATNKGYRLIEDVVSDNGDIFTQNELSSRLAGKKYGFPVEFYSTIDSTNLKAKLKAETGAGSGTLIVADCQSAGRGRRGRDWESPAGKNIYYTLMLKPDIAPDKASMLTLVMAMAVGSALQKSIEQAGNSTSKVCIKWPNDIVIDGKKVCGILTEMSLESEYIHYLVIGVGINVHAQNFADELKDKATDIETACGVSLKRSVLLADIMDEFEKYYDRFLQDKSLAGIRREYENMLVNKDRDVCVLDPGGEYMAKAVGINDSGELVVEMPDNSRRNIFAGEVSVRGIYGYV